MPTTPFLSRILLLLLVAGGLTFALWPAGDLYRQRLEKAETSRMLERSRSQEQSLTERLDRLRNDAGFVESVARKKLGWIGEGEAAFVVIDGEDPPPPPKSNE